MGTCTYSVSIIRNRPQEFQQFSIYERNMTMLDLQMLDVVIGTAFVYLLLSLICSAICEMIEARLKYRARDLERGIRELLKDEKGEWAKKIYDHPLVYGLFKGEYDRDKIDKQKGHYRTKSDLPSYIPPRNFALALIDVVSPSTAGNGPTSSLKPLRDAIDGLPPYLKQALRPLVNAAGDDINKARENIEAWYNSAMERVAGWYKRHTQWILLGLGIVVTVAANADTLAIVDSLSRDSVLRAAVVAQAQADVKRSAPSMENLGKELLSARQLGLPIGWSHVKFKQPDFTLGDYCGLVFSRIVGWIITAFAVSLGAPFWFDILNMFMVARSTIKGKPEGNESRKQKKPEETSRVSGDL